MKIDYTITIRLKDKHWYDLADKSESVKEFEAWDDERTPRYRREVAFRSQFDVLSIQEQKNASYPINLLDSSQNPHTQVLSGLRVLNFVGATQSEQVIISESLIDQVFIEDKSKSKVYIYGYIKEDVNCYEVASNIWLSEEHKEVLNRQVESPFTFLVPDIKLLKSGGIMSC